MRLNVKLFRKIQKHITEEPKRYNQNVWIEHGNFDYFPACGTMGCIGGWAQILSAKPNETPEPSFSKAKQLLGLDTEQAGRLLESVCGNNDGWPRKFARAYMKAVKPATRARIACARIDHFIATKGAE